MPEIRPFRALRFVPTAVGDLAAVVAPPYDVIGPTEAAALAARHPANVVRLDLPAIEDGDEPDDRYRRAARTLAEWRSSGILHKDPHPSIYVYGQDYRVPGTSVSRAQRGFFARLRIEPLEAGGGVRPHERTLSAPKEDRYKLLRATGVNTSPVVVLVDDAEGTVADGLDAFSRRTPDVDLTDDEGVRHRLWAVAADGADADALSALLSAAGRAPVTIADGHHRYETALRYRDERRMSRSCEEDPAFDYLMTLFLPTRPAPLTVLPTHRVVRDLDAGSVSGLIGALGPFFEIEPVASADELATRFEAAASMTGGRGRFGLWTQAGGADLTARQEAFGPYLAGLDPAVRELDVTLLGVILERVLGLGPDAVAAGAVGYTKSAREAIELVRSGADGAGAAFLLEPTPVASIVAVAAAGAVMPQKSTYFYPKALTGLVINPHEW